jgi:hypothetical protein
MDEVEPRRGVGIACVEEKINPSNERAGRRVTQQKE